MMNKISFRFAVDKMLHHKPLHYQKIVWDKIHTLLTYTQQESLSLESVAFIMLQTDIMFEDKS